MQDLILGWRPEGKLKASIAAFRESSLCPLRIHEALKSI